MTKYFVNVADIPDPVTGETPRQANSKLVHNIPIGAIVEVLPYGDTPEEDYNHQTGLRLFVIEHTRDCDQTPLYSLHYLSPYEFARQEYGHLQMGIKSRVFSGLCTGMSEDSLRVFRLPSEQNRAQREQFDPSKD